MRVESTIKQVLGNNGKVEMSNYAPESRFVEDLGMDSLDIAELVIELEKEYRIVIPDDDLENLKTVSETCSYMKERLAEEGIKIG